MAAAEKATKDTADAIKKAKIVTAQLNKALVTALVDMKLLPESMRKLDAV